MTTAKLEMLGVGKSYGPVTALDRTDLTVKQGEFLTLLGPSGSGKTTLLMTISGLVEPSSGSIRIDGVETQHLPVFRRDIGMVFQNYALFPHLSVFENVAFPLRMRKQPDVEIRQAVTRALELVQLAELGRRLPRELSGGQQQRIALARCIVYRPSIILMDEPLGALDKRLRDDMQYEIKKIHKQEGTTILYVTHDQEEALAMSDRICLMNKAGIEQLGTPVELYFSPKSVFAAEFFGELNIVQAKVATAPTTDDASVECEVASAGRFRAAAPLETCSAGQAVKLMVRPENVRVLADTEQADNEIHATVRSTTMLASLTREVYDAPWGPLIAKRLTASERKPITPGERVRLGWSRGDMVVLTQESCRGSS